MNNSLSATDVPRTEEQVKDMGPPFDWPTLPVPGGLTSRSLHLCHAFRPRLDKPIVPITPKICSTWVPFSIFPSLSLVVSMAISWRWPFAGLQALKARFGTPSSQSPASCKGLPHQLRPLVMVWIIRHLQILFGNTATLFCISNNA